MNEGRDEDDMVLLEISIFSLTFRARLSNELIDGDSSSSLVIIVSTVLLIIKWVAILVCRRDDITAKNNLLLLVPKEEQLGSGIKAKTSAVTNTLPIRSSPRSIHPNNNKDSFPPAMNTQLPRLFLDDDAGP
jgi:hypothetical protein